MGVLAKTKVRHSSSCPASFNFMNSANDDSEEVAEKLQAEGRIVGLKPDAPGIAREKAAAEAIRDQKNDTANMGRAGWDGNGIPASWGQKVRSDNAPAQDELSNAPAEETSS